MSLKLYFDELATNPVSEGDMSNPDTVMGDATSGLVEDRPLWVKTAPGSENLTYKDIILTAEGDTAGVNFLYALDEGGVPGAFAESIQLPDGDYSAPFPVWRRVEIQPQSSPLNIVTIKHKLTASVYLKS